MNRSVIPIHQMLALTIVAIAAGCSASATPEKPRADAEPKPPEARAPVAGVRQPPLPEAKTAAPATYLVDGTMIAWATAPQGIDERDKFDGHVIIGGQTRSRRDDGSDVVQWQRQIDGQTLANARDAQQINRELATAGFYGGFVDMGGGITYEAVFNWCATLNDFSKAGAVTTGKLAGYCKNGIWYAPDGTTKLSGRVRYYTVDSAGFVRDGESYFKEGSLTKRVNLP